MAKAKKLPSGQWRTLVYDYTDDKGKRHYESFTAGTKKESEYLAAEYRLKKDEIKKSPNQSMTVMEATDMYITSKNKVLSQTTLKAYLSMRKNLMNDILNVQFTKLNSSLVQSWIGKITSNHSPKTVKNVYGLFSAVTEMYYPEMRFKVKLPQKEKKDVYVPTDSDVTKVIQYFRENDKDMLIATCLAAFGTMRRSELCALTSADVRGNIITVNKALVKAVNNEWIIKTTKNVSSNRDIEMPDFVIDMLPKKGPLVSITPSQVTDGWIRALNQINIQRFRFHDLRHYSASIMHAIGVPDVYIMKRGGWASDGTLKQIYRGSMDDYEKQFTDVTISHFDKMQHEMQHKKIRP